MPRWDVNRDMFRSHILFNRRSLLERALGVDNANELFVVNQLAVKRWRRFHHTCEEA